VTTYAIQQSINSTAIDHYVHKLSIARLCSAICTSTGRV